MGFKIGDLRGGVGVAIPLEKYFENSREEIKFLYFSHFIFWLIGIIGIVIIYRLSMQRAVDKEKTQKITQDAIQADKANQEKSEFLSRMSHELRTPLNSIIGFTQLLQMDSKDSKDSQQQEYCQEVLNSGTHLLDLINEVLDLSKVESGNMEIFIVSLSCDDILNESINMVLPIAESKNIVITYELLKIIAYRYMPTKFG